MSRIELEIDVEGNLRKYLPSIFLLLENQTIDWKKISLNYQKELNFRKSKMIRLQTGSIPVEACFLDIITQIVQFDFTYLNLFRFFDSVFKNLAEKTTRKEKKMLGKTVFNVLVNTNKNYLNFIGEFAIINNMKNAGFELLKVEEPLDDNNKDSTKADFTIRKNNKTLLVEVVNIHLPDGDKLNNQIIEQLLDQKINQKLNSKQRKTNKQFYLTPVLWGDYHALKLINQYYIDYKIAFKNTLPPAAYASYTSKDGKQSSIKFARIDKLLLTD